MEPIQLTKGDTEFIRKVEKESGQSVRKCYQCGNCTAGCPMSFSYDFTTSRIMRLIQLGQRDTVLSSKAIWLCATCETCSTRCPNNIDVARVMDVCRHISRRENKSGARNVRLFADSFLESVNWFGRTYEMGLMGFYKMRSGRFFDDLLLAPGMLMKGKLPFFPHKIKGSKEVSAIFKRYKETLKRDFQQILDAEEKAETNTNKSSEHNSDHDAHKSGGSHA